mmetsp:Transcript_9425/g.20092  ORF Transcript_9425/g.20092 Transcript_9425/m.20092 type:complete len:113 (-) Transcript_9425:334-672(-)
MPTVTVVNSQNQTVKTTAVSGARSLLETVRQSRFFGDAFLEDESKNLIGNSYRLAENAVYMWHPPAAANQPGASTQAGGGEVVVQRGAWSRWSDMFVFVRDMFVSPLKAKVE